MGSSQSSAGSAVSLNSKLERCKAKLSAKLEDPRMMEKTVEFMSLFMTLTLSDSPKSTVPQLLKYTLLAMHMNKMSTDNKGGPRLSDKWKRGITNLTEPRFLAESPNLDENFLSAHALFADMESAAGTYDQPDPVDTYNEIEEEKPKNKSSTMEDKDIRFKEDQQRMLEFLLPMFSVVNELPQTWETQIFKSKDPSKEKEALKMQVGSTAMAVKVAADGKLAGHRAAFVGPESIGKSTAINFVTSDGVGIEFMPATPGMGTQTPCFLSNGVTESIQIGQEKYLGAQVHLELKKYNDRLKTQPGLKSWDNIELLRATKPFETPSPVELVDVPGIKKSTYMDTVLALSISSTMVLCSGKKEHLKSNLETGSLKDLPNIVRELRDPIPILCFVTGKTVTQREAQQNENGYKDILKKFFPSSKIAVQFGNFPSVADETQKKQMVQQFFANVLGEPAKESNPYISFKTLKESMDHFTRGLSQALKREYSGYFSRFEKDLESVEVKLREELANLSTQNSVVSLIKHSGLVQELVDLDGFTKLPVFSLQLASGEQKQDRDTTYVHQEMLDELRIKVKKGLEVASKDVFGECVSKCLDQLGVECFSENAKKITNFEKISRAKLAAKMCDCFAHMCQVDDMGDGQNMLEKCRPLGSLISEDSFQWVTIGYYMLESDEYNKSVLMQETVRFKGEYSNADAFTKWRAHQFSAFNVDYEKWVTKIQKHKSTDGMNDAVLLAMSEAGTKYVQLMKNSELVSSTKQNEPLKLLLEQSYIMLHRLLLYYKMDSGKGKLQFTELVKYLKEETSKHNFSESGSQSNDGDSMEEKLAQCLEIQESLNKLKTGETPEMDNIRKNLEKMGHISQALRARFNHQGKSILFVVPLKSATATKIMKEANTLRLDYNLPTLHGDANKQQGQLLADLAIQTLTHGAHVVVWFRREDITTVDPDDGHGEVNMLQTLKRNAHIVSLYVILPPEMKEAEIDKNNWQQHAKNLQIIFINVEKLASNVRAKVGEMQDDARNAESVAAEKRNKFLKRFDEEFKDFQKTSRAIRDAKHEIARLSPESLHSKTVNNGVLRAAMDSGVKGLREIKLSTTDWTVPDKTNLQTFLKKATDRGNEGKQASSVNELEARIFLLQLMLGQTIAKAKTLAENAYDSTIGKVREQLAGLFCLTDGEMHQMILDFLKDRKLAEDNSEADTYGFTEKAHFVEMYVGVVISIAMPLLCSIVLPCLLKNKVVSGEDYKKAVELARKELYTAGPKSGSLCCGGF